MSCNMKYRNRRKVWWKPGEEIYNPIKLDPVTWKILCQENGTRRLVYYHYGLILSSSNSTWSNLIPSTASLSTNHFV